jgi:hypothetical protein
MQIYFLDHFCIIKGFKYLKQGIQIATVNEIIVNSYGPTLPME